jgi:rubredoxin
MSRYKCKVWGYVYEQETGEKRSKVEPGTVFDDLPEKWCCPTCGALKKSFNEL